MAENTSEDNNSKLDAAMPSVNCEIQSDKNNASATVVTSKSEHGRKKSVIQKFFSSFSVLGHIFYRSSKEDFEKKLQHLSKEEAAAHTRLKRRSQTWRRLARGVIVYSIVIEFVFLGVALVTTRAPELTWQFRALRVLPVFAFPALASLLYSTCASYFRMCERKDQKTVERLRNERQAKIDELKERTDYYLTQQLIHKYDSDPAAKEAAARVLASKLGTDAGLSFAFEPSNANETKMGLTEARNQNVDPLETAGLRRRTKQHSSSGSQPFFSQDKASNHETMSSTGRIDSGEESVEIDQSTGKFGAGGWVARLAAMLVGEDPTQCYALICKNCHMHNGLARREDFQYITYYCPHCHSLNGSSQLGEIGEASGSHVVTSMDAASQRAKNDSALRNALLSGGGIESDVSSSNSPSMDIARPSD